MLFTNKAYKNQLQKQHRYRFLAILLLFPLTRRLLIFYDVGV